MDYKAIAINLMKRLHEASKKNPSFVYDVEEYSAAIAKLHSVTLTDEGKEILAQQLQLLNEYAGEAKGRTLLPLANAVATLIGG